MKARDVMTPDVLTIGQDESVLEAIRLMLQRKVSGLPVVDASGALTGMVTEGDFLRRSELGTERHAPRWIEFLTGPGKLAEEYAHASGRKVRDVMTPEIHAVTEDATLADVVELMERHRIKRVPVTRGRRLAGIITRTNLLRAIAGLTHGATPASSDDLTIRDRLMAELRKHAWAPVAGIDVTVTNGVVTYSGVILDDRQRDALRVAAENVPGVKKVEDRTVWVEPMSGTVIGPPAQT
jgi:CBS domain-containing protein